MSDNGLAPDPDAVLTGFYLELELLKELAQTILSEDGTPSQQTSPEPDPDQCQAITKSGQRCRIRSTEDSIYCHIHKKTAVLS